MKKIVTFIFALTLFSACSISAAPYTPLFDSLGYLVTKDKIIQLAPSVASANNQLAFDMFNYLKQTDDTIFFSPTSMMLALGMTLNGADNQTATQMFSTLHFPTATLDEFNEGMRSLQLSLIQRDLVTMQMTNSIWMRDTFTTRVIEDFLVRNQTNFGAMIASGDFNDEKMVDAINAWVSKHTQKRIKTAIDEPIHPLTVMFLINTIYFKADWKTPFEKTNTFKDTFFNTQTVQVDMMSIIEDFPYMENDDFQMISLPYKDESLSMIVILPKSDNTLTLGSFMEAISQLDEVHVDLKMPKVKIEKEIAGVPLLQQLGMIDAFNSNLADFTKMAADAKETGLHIADVVQKTFLQIDEKGTEAAAMTKVEMRDESMPMSDVVMHVNRPYYVVIYDSIHQVISFMGFISNP